MSSSSYLISDYVYSYRVSDLAVLLLSYADIGVRKKGMRYATDGEFHAPLSSLPVRSMLACDHCRGFGGLFLQRS